MEIESKQQLAIRIKGIAENMMHLEDFVAARNFALRAQKLYANLENISEMLMVCEVHCAADRKLFGGEMDWCGILRVEETADEATIEQQYLKFASVLHPDNNTYPGAEAAFKIIKQAKTVLLSKYEQSSPHCADMERNVQPVPSHGSQGISTDSGNSGYQDDHKSKGVDPSHLQKVQDAATTPATPPATNSMCAATPCGEGDSDEDGIGTTSDNSEDVLLRDLRKCENVTPGKKRKERASESHDLGRNEITIVIELSGSADEVEDQEGATEALGNGSLQRHSEADLNAKSVLITDLNKSPVCYEYADSEFNDFDKDRQEGCFSKGQVWAVYADPDTMPRYYAHIRSVSPSGFSLQITWLEPVSDKRNKRHRIDKSFPAVCGLFEHGESVLAEQRTLFSHLVHWEQGSSKKTFKIFPRMGETWALFKNWNMVRKSDKSAKRKYKYEIVEILSEYNETTGVRVAPLFKVNGFVSIFSQSADDDTVVSTFQILPGQLSRFSHKLPSFKMSGKERKGLPESCFEIDPASLPESICPP